MEGSPFDIKNKKGRGGGKERRGGKKYNRSGKVGGRTAFFSQEQYIQTRIGRSNGHGRAPQFGKEGKKAKMQN